MVSADSAKLSTIEKSFEIVEMIAELDGARVTPLADRMEMAPSTVHNHLKTLEELGYLVKEGDKYHVGLQFLHLGGHAIHRKPGFKLIKEKVENLARTTGERAQFMAEEHGRGFHLVTMTGENAVQVDARIGKPSQLHASAAGKSILANLPEYRRNEILDNDDLASFTENTITDRDGLKAELASIRESGVGFNKEESIEGLHAVGVVVKNRVKASVIGAISISGPTNRLHGDRLEEELPDLLLGTANEIELRIEYP